MALTRNLQSTYTELSGGGGGCAKPLPNADGERGRVGKRGDLRGTVGAEGSRPAEDLEAERVRPFGAVVGERVVR